MENTTPSIKQIAINHGVLLAVASILVLVIRYVANMSDSWIISIISISITIGIFYYAINTFKKENHGYLTVSDAIKIGLATAAIGGLITALYTYIHYSFVDTGFIQDSMNKAREALLSTNPNMPEDQMNMQLAMTEKFTTPFVVATMTLIGSLFFGFILSVIMGVILKNKNPHLEE